MFIVVYFLSFVFYLFVFGVVRGGVGFRVGLSFERVFEWFEVVLVEGVSAKVFAGFVVVVLGVDV